MPRRSVLWLTILLISVTCPVLAGDGDQPIRFDGHKVVRITASDWQQVSQLRGLDLLLLSDGEGLAPVDYLVPPDKMAALDELGVAYRVLNDNIQRLIDAERQRLSEAGPADPRDRGWFDDYKTFAEINQFLDAWVTTYPDMVSKYQIGTSWESRPVYALTISGPVGNPDDKTALCFDAMLHAREWITPMTVLYVMDRLLREYSSDPAVRELLDKTTFYISPVTNPDGYTYSWTPGNRLWRKNRRDNGGGVYGVDLNRNFATGWGGPGSSGDPSSSTYRGPSPFSEPETQALSDFILAHDNIVAHIDFHSYSQLIMWPFGYDYIEPPEPDRTIMDDLAHGMADAIFGVHGMTYDPQPCHELYLCSGICTDWVYDGAGAFSWTIELRDNGQYGFVLPPDQIIPTGEENYAAVRLLAEFYTLLLKIEFPAGLPARLVPGTPEMVPVRITNIGGTLDPSSPKLYTRVGGSGPFDESPLADLGGGLYQATLPGIACGRTLDYYFTAETTGSQLVASPPDAPATVYQAEALPLAVPLEANMETDPGWSAQGQWAWGQPTGGGGQYGSPDPTSGCTGDNVCGYNLQGDYTNNMPEYHLTTPAFDCSGLQQVRLSFWRWLGVERNQYDHAYIRISTDGTTWQTVWANPDQETADTAWVHQDYDISAYADNEPEVYLRWTMGTTDSGWVYCGWNIDDVRVWAVDPNGCPGALGDLNCDSAVDFGDINPFVLALTDPAGYAAAFPDCDIMNGDINEDGEVDFGDINPFVWLLTQP